MKTISLNFRGKLPDGKYFYQKNQHLPSFLRRFLLLCEVSHPAYLKKDLEEYLEIFIGGEWVNCDFKPETLQEKCPIKSIGFSQVGFCQNCMETHKLI